MKFGLEAEKFLFNLKTRQPSRGVFRFLDALSDFENESSTKITNEFVLNMVEFGTKPSALPMEVLKDYLFSYLMLKEVAAREQVALVPLGSLPMDYLPHMTPKWPYLIQNSILGGTKADNWMMQESSPLRAAGNCAGIHVHIELETAPEFLFANRELQDKFNMALMLTPLVAFASSPYFYGAHQAVSMRAQRYFYGVYQNFSLNGGLPPVMGSSIDVLEFVRRSIEHWLRMGTGLGFCRTDIEKITNVRGANWNPVRWNRQWNTIEIRCLDSDSIDMDASIFIWICSAMKRLDLKGEALACTPLKARAKVDKGMLRECFDVRGGRVSILGEDAIREVFEQAIGVGLKSPLVEQYLYRLQEFAQKDLPPEHRWAFRILGRVLSHQQTTAEKLLRRSAHTSKIAPKKAADLVSFVIRDHEKIIRSISKFVPEVFNRLEASCPRV